MRRDVAAPTLPTEATGREVAAAGKPLPSFPAIAGAYVLSDNHWVRLPRNNGHVVQSSGDAFTAKLTDEELEKDPGAANTPLGLVAIGRLMFDGAEDAPVAPRARFVLAYVGQASAPGAAANAPAIEVAALTGTVGFREAMLYPVAPRRPGFGRNRIAAALEQPRADVTVLRPVGAMARGRYAVLCGTEAFEVMVQ